jgi:hypothetical protein
VLDRLVYDIEQPRTSIKLILSASSLIHRAGLGYQLCRYGTSLASPIDWRCVMTLCIFRSLSVTTPVTTPVTLQTLLKLDDNAETAQQWSAFSAHYWQGQTTAAT